MIFLTPAGTGRHPDLRMGASSGSTPGTRVRQS